MDKELLRTVCALKSKTGIDIDLAAINGGDYISTRKDYVPQDLPEFDGEFFGGDGKTYFKFDFNGEKYVGILFGGGAVYKNYALFIADYLEARRTDGLELSYLEAVAAAITGEISRRRTRAVMEKFSMPETKTYVTLFTADGDKLPEIKDFLNDYSINGSDVAVQVEGGVALASFSEGDEEPPVKYVSLILQTLFEETGIKARGYIGGFVKDFSYAALSYGDALSAKRISGFLKENKSVYSYKDYVLCKIIEELPRKKAAELTDVLLGADGKSVLKDDELVKTALAFLDNDLNISETARAMFLHRNTLMYRLDKIERITGIDVRDFNGAVTFKLLYTLNKMAD